MDNIIEIRATVRREMLDRVVCALKESRGVDWPREMVAGD